MTITDPMVEAQALDETEQAMRDLVQAGINIGLKRAQVVMMLRRIAADIEPTIIAPSTDAVQ